MGKLWRGVAGLLYLSAFAVAAVLLSKLSSSLGVTFVALLLGVVIRNLIPRFLSQAKERALGLSALCLNLAILSLGFSLKMEEVAQSSGHFLAAMFLSLFLSLLLCWLAGRRFALDSQTSLLVGIGSGICGSSAIAASSKLVTDDRSKVAVALASINLVGLLGLFIWPVVANTLDLAPDLSTLLIGATMQSLGQVAAAAGMVQAGILDDTLALKMGRVALLLPLLASLLFLRSRMEKFSFRLVPSVLIGFAVMLFLGNAVDFSFEVEETIQSLSRFFLVGAMFSIGHSVGLKQIKASAPVYVYLALFIFILQSAAVFLLWRFF